MFEKRLLRQVSYAGIFLSVMAIIISAYWLFTAPNQWVSGLRFSILYSPYSPTWKDVMFYAIFYLVGFYTKFRYSMPYIFFFVWAFDELSNVFVNFSQIPLYFSIDPYYFLKVFIFFFLFCSATYLLVKKAHYTAFRNKLLSQALVIYFIVWVGFSILYTVTGNTFIPPFAFLYHAGYLALMFPQLVRADGYKGSN